MIKVFFFAIISSLLMSCSHYTELENQYLELIDDLSDKEKATEAFNKISKLGKEIIPNLLENSKKKKYLLVRFLLFHKHQYYIKGLLLVISHYT